MYEGRFFDGKTAAERRVQVRFSDTAVHIEGDDIALEWPKGQVDVDHRHGGHQLTSSADIDARLVLPDTFDIRMELKRHGLSASKRQARRTLKIAGALLVATL